jgi:hypothetical protein
MFSMLGMPTMRREIGERELLHAALQHLGTPLADLLKNASEQLQALSPAPLSLREVFEQCVLDETAKAELDVLLLLVVQKYVTVTPEKVKDEGFQALLALILERNVTSPELVALIHKAKLFVRTVPLLTERPRLAAYCWDHYPAWMVQQVGDKALPWDVAVFAARSRLGRTLAISGQHERTFWTEAACLDYAMRLLARPKATCREAEEAMSNAWEWLTRMRLRLESTSAFYDALRARRQWHFGDSSTTSSFLWMIDLCPKEQHKVHVAAALRVTKSSPALEDDEQAALAKHLEATLAQDAKDHCLEPKTCYLCRPASPDDSNKLDKLHVTDPIQV